eukprot:2461170-Pleurochrysis_carterae.AAC.3
MNMLYDLVRWRCSRCCPSSTVSRSKWRAMLAATMMLDEAMTSFLYVIKASTHWNAAFVRAGRSSHTPSRLPPENSALRLTRQRL